MREEALSSTTDANGADMLCPMTLLLFAKCCMELGALAMAPVTRRPVATGAAAALATATARSPVAPGGAAAVVSDRVARQLVRCPALAVAMTFASAARGTGESACNGWGDDAASC